MALVTITNKGNYEKTTNFLQGLLKKDYIGILNKYGDAGVQVLANATPIDSGKTAQSWSYEVRHDRTGYTLAWYNSNTNQGLSIVVLNQYGHATRDGGWVQGVDFINPAMKPFFDELVEELWREVGS